MSGSPESPQWGGTPDGGATPQAATPQAAPTAEPAPAHEAEPAPAQESQAGAAMASASAMSASAGRAASSLWAGLSPAERMVVVGGFGIGVVYLVGVVLRALGTESSWLVAALVGVAAGVMVLLPAARRTGWPVPAAAIVLGCALAAAAITVVEGLEMLADFADDLDDGGVLYVGLVALAAVAGVVTLAGADRLAGASTFATLRTGIATAGRGDRVALGGMLLFLLGWVLSVTIGVFQLGFQGSLAIAAVTLAVAGLVGARDGWRVQASWVVAACAGVGAVLGLVMLVDFLDEAAEIGAGIDLLWPFLLMFAGLAVFVAGAALKVVDERAAPAPAGTAS
jgi:hypothetical protein